VGKVAVMTTLDDVTKKKAEQSAEQKAAVELVRLAQEQGPSLTGLRSCPSSSPRRSWSEVP
jgi:hypothetical protein